MTYRRGLWKGLWALAVLAAFAAGCGDDDGGTKPDESGNPITFPLATGNTWSYAAEETREGGTDAYARLDEVTGTESIGGETYYELQTTYSPALLRALRGSGLLRDRSDEKALQPGSGSILLRQEGQKIYTFLDFDTAGAASEIVRWAYDQLNASMPWQIADFTSARDSGWTLLHAERTFDVQGTPVPVEIDVAASNQGRASVTVPKGTYTDVYHGRLIMSVSSTQGLLTITSRETQEIWVKDSIGVVKEFDEVRVEITGADPAVETLVSQLTDFTLQR